MPGGEVGAPYSISLIASGGTPPYGNWTVSGGSLPPGLTLSPSVGVISGTPNASGTFTFSVTVTDSAGVTSSPQPVKIPITSVNPPSGCSPTGLLIQAITPQSGFSAVMGQPVSIQVSISDNCGTPVLTGKGSAVIATFSNNDPSIVLGGAGSGKWVAS